MVSDPNGSLEPRVARKTQQADQVTSTLACKLFGNPAFEFLKNLSVAQGLLLNRLLSGFACSAKLTGQLDIVGSGLRQAVETE